MSAPGEILALAGLGGGTEAAAAVAQRGDIFRMVEAAETAVLCPAEPGGLPIPLRGRLAAGMAEAHGLPELAAHYRARTETMGDVALADGLEQAVAAFAEMAAMRPRDATGGDIDALRGAGLAEPDIVRLCELTAFVAFHIRVVIGLRVMEGQ
ncbi:hypothetical protein DXV76_05645 [Rhodobacteraceae bacterium CCMM004]|nr:hypothetical protein DXV76_05645 [Rhodobacteraceae bacterium CCMM004]